MADIVAHTAACFPLGSVAAALDNVLDNALDNAPHAVLDDKLEHALESFRACTEEITQHEVRVDALAFMPARVCAGGWGEDARVAHIGCMATYTLSTLVNPRIRIDSPIVELRFLDDEDHVVPGALVHSYLRPEQDFAEPDFAGQLVVHMHERVQDEFNIPTGIVDGARLLELLGPRGWTPAPESALRTLAHNYVGYAVASGGRIDELRVAGGAAMAATKLQVKTLHTLGVRVFGDNTARWMELRGGW